MEASKHGGCYRKTLSPGHTSVHHPSSSSHVEESCLLESGLSSCRKTDTRHNSQRGPGVHPWWGVYVSSVNCLVTDLHISRARKEVVHRLFASHYSARTRFCAPITAVQRQRLEPTAPAVCESDRLKTKKTEPRALQREDHVTGEGHLGGCNWGFLGEITAYGKVEYHSFDGGLTCIVSTNVVHYKKIVTHTQ